jgi:hypothetical protein
MEKTRRRADERHSEDDQERHSEDEQERHSEDEQEQDGEDGRVQERRVESGTIRGRGRE